jgi:hypothetical protein
VLVVVAVLLLGGIAFAVVKATGGDDTSSVQGVADAAVSAAKDLDLDAGVALMCSPPSSADVDYVNHLISEARSAAGGNPDVSYAISDVRDSGGAGRFTVTITTSEAALSGSHGKLVLLVQSHNGHSCISGIYGFSSDATFRSR